MVVVVAEAVVAEAVVRLTVETHCDRQIFPVLASTHAESLRYGNSAQGKRLRRRFVDLVLIDHILVHGWRAERQKLLRISELKYTTFAACKMLLAAELSPR